ncbi:hypothetical protein DKL61_08255 [Gammaproteobacteria bacterium ESL0073]|nr:hypothetical protein DKL61_08255 [Gammaproteobacteria bacterium ESL0073]
MLFNHFAQVAYKPNYKRVTLSLLLSISPAICAQQLPCNPSCSNTSGEYINEINRVGVLTVDNVALSGVAPADASGNYTYENTVLSLGRGIIFPGTENSELNATKLTIKSQASLNTHARAITLGSHSNNTMLTSTINDSSIIFKSANGSSGKNTIGILMESDMSGQVYNINFKNTDMHISSSASNNMVGGIWTYSTNGFAETNIALDNSNLTVESALGSAYGIRTENKNNPQNSIITIQDLNPGSINVKGYGAAYGISIDTLGKNTIIENKSDINVQTTAKSGQAYGIFTRTQESIINTQAQNITVKGGILAHGINTQGMGNQTIVNSAAITVESSNQATGILTQSTSNTGNVTVSTVGDITVRGSGNTYGISATSGGNSTIDVASKIDASNATGTGIYSKTTSGDNNIRLHAGANVIGGSNGNSAGISMQSISGNQKLTLEQGSQLSSLGDLALSSENYGGNTEINNSGTIIGYANLTGDNVAFNNQSAGVIDLKDFGQGSKGDITYNVGSSNGTFNNAGLIKFADENFDGTATNAIFNVATFNNSGIINLTGKNPDGKNDLVGDTFTINGNYVSEGGSIYLNTVLDDASSNGGQGTSDLVVVNGDVTTGSGATNLYITPTASTANLGQLTMGDGIKVVDVQGTSSTDAFKLGRPVVAGAYEYTLGQGQNDENWYLSSYYKGNSGGNGIIQYNPAMGAYLANQTAAVQMFQQTLFDRLISSSDGKNNDASKSLFWMRTKMTHGSYDSIHGSLSNRTRSYSLQMGGDLNVWALNNGGYFHLGVMGGYGDFKDTSKSDTTGTKTDGKVKGYSTGIYGTYFANQDTNLGLYVDLWSQMGWYRNEVSGEAQIGTKKYNSTVWSNSVEVGYGLPLAISGEYQWLATPQAQFTYNHYDVDNQHDKNNLYISNNNASGLDTRLGVRFHARGVQKDLIEPFLEVNWLNTTAKNELDFNGKSYKDGFAKDRFEAKVGLQGNINERWSVSAQVGGQWGNNSYNNYQGQLNINYKF